MASSLNGTGITFSNATTLSSAPVTSIATGNGLSGGPITTTGTLTIAAPTQNTVGSYVLATIYAGSFSFGSNYAAGGSSGQVQLGYMYMADPSCINRAFVAGTTGSLSGTWKWLGSSITGSGLGHLALAVRVA